MLALVQSFSLGSALSPLRGARLARARAIGRPVIWLLLVTVTLGVKSLAAQTPPPSTGDRELPVNVAGDLLDNALAQEIEGGDPALLRRSRAGKIGFALILASLLAGMRLLYVRRQARSNDPASSQVGGAGSPGAEGSWEGGPDAEGPGDRRDREGREGREGRPDRDSRSDRDSRDETSRERSGRSRSGEGRSHRPYRSRRDEPPEPLALPPHVLAILARANTPPEPTGEGPAPYHAPGDSEEGKPPQPDAPPEKRLDLIVPGFTPWKKK